MAFFRRSVGTSLNSSSQTLKHLKWKKLCLVSLQQSAVLNNNLLEDESTAYDLKRRFVPMTRKTLIRKLMENDHLVRRDDQEKFFDFSVGFEATLSREFHKKLMELKQLYDPLNPDKETLMIYHVGSKQRREQEFWLLQKLSELLEKAHFEEIPRQEIKRILDDHKSHEGVMVKVDVQKFEVIRIWTLGADHVPLSHNGLGDWMKNKFLTAVSKRSETTPTCKRVVVAVRSKNQNKLFLKAFKDIPKHGLEYILPEGKISISKYDKSLIATTVTIGGLSIATWILSSLADLNVSWTTAVVGVTGLLAFRTWDAYKNKRNKYLVNLSKSFYYKTLANNRALLTLVVDRSEDEVFKAALMAYTFIRMENIARGASLNHPNVYMDGMVTVDELNKSIENWMKLRHDVDIVFDARFALQSLEQVGLLKSQKLGSDVHVDVLSLDDALRVLPSTTVLTLGDRDEELDIEDIQPVTDNEKIDFAEKERQRIAESNAAGWQ